MKKNILLIICSIALLASVNACKDSNGGGSSIPSLGKVSMKLDGKSWEAQNGTATLYSIHNINTVIVAGAKIDISNPTNSEVVTISIISAINGELVTGTYDASSDANLPKAEFFYQIIENGVQTTWFSTSGKVILTKIDGDTYQGTFKGTVEHLNDGSTKSITSGGFNVKTFTYPSK